MNETERRRQRKTAAKAAKNTKPVRSARPSPEEQTLTIQQALDLAVRHHTAGRLPQAESVYQQILQTDPNQPVALHLLGVIAHQVGKNDIAVDLITKALAIMPDYAEAHSNLGIALLALGKLDEAVASYHKALAIKPDYAEAHSNLGEALQRLGKMDGAVASYHKAIAIKPDYAEAHYNLGNALQEQGKLENAVAAYHRALELKPGLTSAHNNLGVALKEQGKLDEAVATFHRALELMPDDAEAHNNLGAAHQGQGRLDDAVAAFHRALELKPDYAKAHMNLGMVLLLLGDLQAGWKEYEWRWQTDEFTLPIFAQPEWDGRHHPYKTILLYGEQGLGDAIQFVRYSPLVRRLGMHVIVEVQETLVRLLRSVEGIDQLIPKGSPLPAFHFHAPLLSLPRLLGTTLETIPAKAPYLVAEPDLVAAWRERLDRKPGFRIGIAWQGNPINRMDPGRSIPLSCLAPIGSILGVRLIGLQKEHGRDQLADLPENMTLEDLGPELDNGSDAFIDTAAVMMNLDLIVTSDTSIAHLAGALGRPVWVALRFVPNWRWLMNRDYSPWYPTMRLFRQPEPGDWVAVIYEVTRAIEELRRESG